MEFNRWWLKEPEEIFWLETTNRKDLGSDLNAPQFRDDGKKYFGYSLITEPQNNDFVLHYHMDTKSIVAVSKVSGDAYKDTVFWAARGTTAQAHNVRPYLRDGWRRGLIDFKRLDQPVALEQIRALENDIRSIRQGLEMKYGESLYFPFELAQTRPLRPTQAYMTKFPKDIISLIPALEASVHHLQQPSKSVLSTKVSSRVRELGSPYRLADEIAAVSTYEPFTVDPAIVERAKRSHAITQNALANYLKSKGIEPRSPQHGEPVFDLAWTQNGTIFVAEIKSLTDENEEIQLRLGLGQVLRYRHSLSLIYGVKVRAILMAEKEPTDPTWVSLCRDLGILLIWQGNIDKYL